MDTEREGSGVRACAVCGYPLDEVLRRGQSQGYLHVRTDMREDHVPVPVDPNQIRMNQRCDFCDAEPVTAMVLCTTFDLPLLGPRTTSVGNWAACTDCGQLVRRGRWSALVTRVKQVGPPTTRRQPRRDIEAIYRAVQAHMIGVISVQEWLDRLP